MTPPEIKDWPWVNQAVRWNGATRTIPAAGVIAPDGRIWNIYDVSSLFPDTVERKRPRGNVSGFAFHHDGVLFSGADANFDGHSLDESLWRLKASYDHAIAMGWRVFPYHACIDNEGRIFIARKDVLDTQRAHVAGINPETSRSWNADLIGVCIMGNFADAKDSAGKPINMDADRPLPASMAAADAFMQYVTNLFGRRMTLKPHKWYARFPGQDWKPCPGESWVGDNAWSADPLRPFFYEVRELEKPEEPAPPAPDPQPEPVNAYTAEDAATVAAVLGDLGSAADRLLMMQGRHK